MPLRACQQYEQLWSSVTSLRLSHCTPSTLWYCLWFNDKCLNVTLDTLRLAFLKKSDGIGPGVWVKYSLRGNRINVLSRQHVTMQHSRRQSDVFRTWVININAHTHTSTYAGTDTLTHTHTHTVVNVWPNIRSGPCDCPAEASRAVCTDVKTYTVTHHNTQGVVCHVSMTTIMSESRCVSQIFWLVMPVTLVIVVQWKCPCEPRQWANISYNSLALINGMQPNNVIWYDCAFPAMTRQKSYEEKNANKNVLKGQSAGFKLHI